ncbi:hypothetical protein D9M69_558370 [compost metagenome]
MSRKIVVGYRRSGAAENEFGAVIAGKHTGSAQRGVARRLLLLEAWLVSLIDNDKAYIGER